MTDQKRTKTRRLADDLHAFILQREPLIENVDGPIEIKVFPKGGTFDIEMRPTIR